METPTIKGVYLMEVIAALIIFALGEEIKANHREINALSDDLLVLQAAHASLHARQRVDHDTHHRKIDLNIERINNIEMKMNSGN